MGTNGTTFKFSLGFPDMNEWKISHFNRVIDEQQIQTALPRDRDFMGLYFNLGSPHEWKINQLGQKTIHAGQYNFVFLPQQSAQVILPQGLYSVLCIEFSINILKNLITWFPLIDSILKCADRKTPAVLSPLNMIITSEINESVSGVLLNNRNYQGQLKEIADHSKVINLLFSCLDNIRVFFNSKIKRSDLEKAVKMHDYLLLHLKSNFTVDQLADVVDLDKRKLEKIFKAVYRKGVHRFFLDEKLKHAAILLRDTNIPAKQIGREIGFQLPSRFSEAFKKMYGISPSEYRNLPAK